MGALPWDLPALPPCSLSGPETRPCVQLPGSFLGGSGCHSPLSLPLLLIPPSGGLTGSPDLELFSFLSLRPPLLFFSHGPCWSPTPERPMTSLFGWLHIKGGLVTMMIPIIMIPAQMLGLVSHARALGQCFTHGLLS